MLNKFLKQMAPFVALAMSATLAGCDRVDLKINGVDMVGVPLSELDMSGDPPTALAMLGPDTVVITEGDSLSIDVEGDEKAVDALRFTFEDGTLGVARDSDVWDKGIATVRVTMPAPQDLVMAGSGRIEAPAMAKNAEIAIGGSGSITVANFAAEQLEIIIGGSGDVIGGGTAERLEINIGGSGKVDLRGLKADRAEITIAGSGDVRFASDGEVVANIIGSGDVRVTGNAKCEANTIGSGSLTCENSSNDEEAVEPEDA